MEYIDTTLPLHSRIWIYQSNRFFTDAEANALQKAAKEFAAQWTSHKVGVAGDAAVLHRLFLILAADENVTGVSGCSIDSSVHFVRSIEKQYHISFFDRKKVAYMQDGQVFLTDVGELQKAMQQDLMPKDITVFNNLVNTLGRLKTDWLQPYQQSWVKNYQPAEISGLTL